MPGNRRFKYLGKCILKGVYVGRDSCPGMGRLNINKIIVKYIYVGGASCPGIGVLNIYVSVF
jgi:hypothetical protein